MASVDLRATPFDESQGMNQFGGYPLVADGEVVAGALGLGAPESLSRYLHATHAVVFLSQLAAHRRMPSQASDRRDVLHSPCSREAPLLSVLY